jgi:hypothetical protein
MGGPQKRAKYQVLVDEAKSKRWHALFSHMKWDIGDTPAALYTTWYEDLVSQDQTWERQWRASEQQLNLALDGYGSWRIDKELRLSIPELGPANVGKPPAFTAPLRWSVQVKGWNTCDPAIPAGTIYLPHHFIIEQPMAGTKWSWPWLTYTCVERCFIFIKSTFGEKLRQDMQISNAFSKLAPQK